MSEQELKSRLDEIIGNNNIERIAEAIIAAGIGDVSEWKHRAERAEAENAELKARLEKLQRENK